MIQSVDKAIEEYEKLGRRIFEKKLPWLTRWDATYDHITLEECLKEVIKNSPLRPSLSRDALFKDPSRRCRTFVITTTLLENSPKPALLRSYDTKRGERYPAFPGKIWEAGRATSAAPTFFKPLVYEDPPDSNSTEEATDSSAAEEPTEGVATEESPAEVKISKPRRFHTYSDGATIANNPTFEAIMEACRLWEPSAIDCIVSLGTGPEGTHTLGNASLEILGPWGVWLCQKTLSRSMFYRLQLAFYSLQKMTGTEYAHHNTTAAVQTFRGSDFVTDAETDEATIEEVYFRLNVTDPEAKVGLDAWWEMERLIGLAEKYVTKDPIAKTSTQAIAKILVRPDKELSHRRGQMKGPPAENDVFTRRPKFVFIRGYPPQYTEARCTLDTGADNNFVSQEFVTRWQIPKHLLVGDERETFHLLGRKSFTPAFTITLRFTLGMSSNTFTANFYMVKDLPIEVLIGSKFIVDNELFKVRTYLR